MTCAASRGVVVSRRAIGPTPSSRLATHTHPPTQSLVDGTNRGHATSEGVRSGYRVIVEHLSLKDFRNYAEAELALGAGPNVLVGRNGQGKTNLAEAIAYLATLGSHRVSADAPLVREGQDAAFVRARLRHGARTVTLELQINKQGANKARIGGTSVRPGELPRYAQVVLFAPEDLQIVPGEPVRAAQVRRSAPDPAHPAHGGGAGGLRPHAETAHDAAEVGQGPRHEGILAPHARCVG